MENTKQKKEGDPMEDMSSKLSKFIIDFVIKDNKVLESRYIEYDNWDNPQETKSIISVNSPRYKESTKDQIINLILYTTFQAKKSRTEIVELDSEEIEIAEWDNVEKKTIQLKPVSAQVLRYKCRSKIPQYIINSLYMSYISIDTLVPIWPELPENIKIKSAKSA